jgi:hypothetical protein
MSTPQIPSTGRARSQPPANWYPSIDGKTDRSVVHAINQSYQLSYAVRDQTTANTDSINRMIQYGTHQARTQQAPTALPDGSLWYETDRPTWVYQVRLSKTSNQLDWFYAGGMVIGVALADLTDLGLNDTGAIDILKPHIYQWDGKSFVAVFP